MTQRLYYHDSYVRDFTAAVVGASPEGATVYLDRTAFYPTSGGQPYDTGMIAGTPVLEVG
jgi:alanyl-tRNA synthetase